MDGRALIDDALQKAERSEPPVRGAARLHIARVLTAFDKTEARTLLRSGIAEIENLQLTPQDRHFLEGEMVLLTAAVEPDLVESFSRDIRHFGHGWDFRLISIMLDHGHLQSSVAYLMNYPSTLSYPHDAIGNVMAKCTEHAEQLALFRRSVQAWRDGRKATSDFTGMNPRHGRSSFLRLFAYHWTLLEEAEARQVVRDLVEYSLSQEEYVVQVSFDPEQQVRMTSSHQYELFELLHALRRLDPELADSLIDQYPELQAAAAHFPLGRESIRQACEKRVAPTQNQAKTRPGYILGGSASDMRFGKALLDSRFSKRFDEPFDHALKTLEDDTAFNSALRECWPSTQDFRSVLYEAGKAIGSDAAALLPRIPDLDLRLFAQIELAAALAGLPAYSGTRVTSRRR